MNATRSGVNMVKRSKYYIAEESWTKRPAWAFEVPTDYIESEPDSVVTLRFETGPSTGVYQELQVPCSYLKLHMLGLWIRPDRRTVSLFLSAEAAGRFTDRRGPGATPFAQFLRLAGEAHG
jgi:hypothetical protein